MMRIAFCIISVFIASHIKCQILDTLSTLLHARPSVDARLESRYSFMNHTATKVSGVRLGVSFKRKLRLGIGYSWLNSDIKEPLTITDNSGTTRYINNYFKFGYVCYYADFVFHKKNRWQLSVPIQVGTGMYWWQYHDGKQLINSKKRLLLFYEPGITVQFKVFKWCGLGLDVCARLALRNTNYVSNQLNSFVLAPKLLIWFDQLFYSVAPKSKITQKYGPAIW